MLLESPRHSPEDLAAWGAFERHVRLYALANRRKLAGLERRSVAALEAFGAPAWAGVSWGKDSVVMADLVTRYRPDVPLCWVVTVPGENPDCWRVRDAFLDARRVRVYREYEDRVKVAGGTLQVDDDEAWPPCVDFGPRYVSGIRAEESRVRRLRARTWGESSPNTCAPLAWWAALDVVHRGCEADGRTGRRDSRRDAMDRNIETVTAYIDSQDPSDTGWAYRVEYSDGHQESGALDTEMGDETGSILVELEATVAAHGGNFAAGSWRYHENESGYYVWTA